MQSTPPDEMIVPDGGPRLRTRLLRPIAQTLLPRSVLVTCGDRSSRRVALTFDDGPDERTGEYLALLDRLRLRATFFLLGRHAERRPNLVRDIVAAGHEVASHGYSHRCFGTMTSRTLADELIHTSDYLPPTPRRRPLVRPPKGDLSPRALLWIAGAGYTTVLWSLDSDDCRTRDPEVVASRVAGARGGDIVLLHEGQSWTLEALPSAIEGLRARGLEPTTVGDLLGE